MRLVAAAMLCGAVMTGIWLVASLRGLGSASPADPEVPERPAAAFALRVDHVDDGDTIRATPLTTNDVVATADSVRIRLVGIDTPEGTPAVECGADAARAHLTALLPEGARVWVAVDRESWDRYGRRLLLLWTDGGTFVNHDLVATGHAVTLTVPPNTAHAALFESAESAARASGLGRWGSC